MFTENPLQHANFKENELYLTFDDGPGTSEENQFGPKTIEIANYLNNEGIEATFFMTGNHITQYPTIPEIVKSLNHQLGHHTFSHPQMDVLLKSNGDVLGEMSITETILNNYIKNEEIFFRPPYGSWDSEVSIYLNQNLLTAPRYIGPIYWQIDAGDWAHYDQRLSPIICAKAYLKKILELNRGVILMHDSSADPGDRGTHLRNGNRCLELIKIIIPILKSLGYTFIRLDKVENIS